MNPSSKKKLLVFADWFEPGNKGGGIIRSCVNFARLMKEKFEVYVFTRDRDLNDEQPYKNIVCDEWVEFEPGIQVYYCSPANLRWKSIRSQVKRLSPSYVYLNSMFSLYFTIYPVLMLRSLAATVVLAPRGMLKVSALRFKPAKKKLFLSLFRLLSLHKKLRFHATDQTELTDIRTHFSDKVNVTLLVDAHPPMTGPEPAKTPKSPGSLSTIFVGRIHPIKNLHYLLQLLPRINGNISLTVVGGEEDKEYARECRGMTTHFPANIKVDFIGEIANEQLPRYLKGQHLFVLPSSGENFGHAIFEALDAGKPVLISNMTPWRDLESSKAGWDLPLDDQEQFRQAFQRAVDFDQQEYDLWSCSSRKYLRQFIDRADLKTGYFKLFS